MISPRFASANLTRNIVDEQTDVSSEFVPASFALSNQAASLVLCMFSNLCSATSDWWDSATYNVWTLSYWPVDSCVHRVMCYLSESKDQLAFQWNSS